MGDRLMVGSLSGRPETLFTCPEWLLHDVDLSSGSATLLRLSEAEYRAASFLDQRVEQRNRARQVNALAHLEPPAGTRGDVQYIFHIGHVGSTLLARLLGEVPGLFSIREPLVLRTLAALGESARESLLPAVTALLSRTFRPADRALVKATSFVSEIAPELVPAGSATLMMYAKLPNYMCGILAGEASRQELAALHASRAARLAVRVPGLDAALATGEARQAALAWACEMTSLEAAAAALPANAVAWLDFDRFLADPAWLLGEAARLFGAVLLAAEAEALAAGPLMNRYSKAPEHAYSPALRQALLREAAARHRAEIADALGWLAAAAPSNPLLARALSRGR